MVSRAFMGLLSAVLLSANGCLMMGCASTEKTQAHQSQLVQNVGTSLEVLERGQFEGDINFQSGGPVIALGMENKNAIFAGPGDVLVSIKGRVNFKDPSLRPASDPALTASLPPDEATLAEIANRIPIPAAWVKEHGALKNKVRDLEKQVDGQQDMLTKLASVSSDAFPKAGPPADGR